MRKDTEEICELLDKAADLVKREQLEAAQELLVAIERLLIEWVERNLSPCEKSGP